MKKNIILTILITAILCAIIINPQHYISICFQAINVWATILVPSLLPFFIFTKLLTKLGTIESISKIFSKVTVNIYKNSQISAYIFFMSILTGYPVGSKLVADLYHSGSLSKTNAKKCLTFCSNSGPMFIIGSVGISMLLSKTAGYIMISAHIISSLLNGLIYRNIKDNEDKPYTTQQPTSKQENLLSTSVMDSILSILLVGGIVVIAFIIIEILQNINLFYPITSLLSSLGVDSSLSSSILAGIFEITKGTLSVSSLNITLSLKTIICSTLISFGGLSTILQSMAFASPVCSYKFMILQKTTHALLTCVVTIGLCLIFL